MLGPLSGCSKEDPCSDLSGLTEEDLSDRKDANYVARTPDPEKRCNNCDLWIAPEGKSPCGGCDVLAGPIHPNGYCDVWVLAEATGSSSGS